MSAWNNGAARGGSVDNGDEREAKLTLSLNQVVAMPGKHWIQTRLVASRKNVTARYIRVPHESIRVTLKSRIWFCINECNSRMNYSSCTLLKPLF